MDATKLLNEYEAALKRQADADVTIKVLEMKAKLFAQPQPHATTRKKRRSKTEIFIDDHPELTERDIQFLSKIERATREVAEYLDCATNKASERLRKGDFRPGQSDKPGGNRMFDAQSVVEVVLGIDAKTDTK